MHWRQRSCDCYKKAGVLTTTTRLARVLSAVVCSGLPVAASLAGTDGFEAAVDQSPAQLLPTAMVSGVDFHVTDPVHGDGLMYRFVIDSRFGRFDAYGRTALALRVREVQALGELSRISSIEIVAVGVGHGVGSELNTASAVLTHPMSTATGIPKGIAHLFYGYKAQGEEALASANRSATSLGSGSASVSGESHKAEEAAKHYAERYLGISGAERDWYKRLGVNPYTDNTVLHDAIHKAARTEAVGRFGVKFASLPAIPGINITQSAVDAIYNEDPAAVRARTRKTLTGYGLTAAEIESWLNAPLLNPARQVLLLMIAAQLDGVAGRAELFRHSLGLISDAEVQVYLVSAGLLTKANASHHLASIISGVRLPSAQLADGRSVVCGAFEAVYWTSDVATGEEQLRMALPAPADGVGRELWLVGTVSDRARAELGKRGWELHEVPEEPGPDKRRS
jgi:hypothetical protein